MEDNQSQNPATDEKQTAEEIFLTTKQEVKDFTQKAYNKGYKQMKIPGGTSPEGDYSSQVAIIKYRNGEIYALLISYDLFFRKNNTDEKNVVLLDENPETTAKRKVKEKAGINVTKLIEVYRQEDNGVPEARKADPGKSYDKHEVHRFIGTEYQGEIPFFPDFKNPDDAEIGQPVWVNVRHLAMSVVRGNYTNTVLYWKHIDTVCAAIKHFATSQNEYHIDLKSYDIMTYMQRQNQNKRR